MTKRYLNFDPNGADLTSESDRYKQRVRNGLGRPLVAQPYNAERGTRIEETVDKPISIAQPLIIFYVKNFINKFYPEIAFDYFSIESIEPLSIKWQFDLKKDVK